MLSSAKLKLSFLFLFLLLTVTAGAERGNCQTSAPGTQVATSVNPSSTNPRYTFRAVVQAGETIDGYTIKDFRPEPMGVNIAMNEKGQTAYIADTNKGKAMFRDRTFIAAMGATESGKVKSGFGPPTIDSKGHVSYLYISGTGSSFLNYQSRIITDGKVIIHSGTAIKDLKSTILYCFGCFYNSKDELCVPVILKNKTFAVLANGNFDKFETQKFKGRINAFEIDRDNGYTIEWSDNYLRRLDKKEYPFVNKIFSMNDLGHIFIVERDSHNAYVVGYNDASDNANRSQYDNKRIIKIEQLLSAAINKQPTAVNGPVQSVALSLDTLTHNFINLNKMYMSSQGRGVVINNHDQLAMYGECYGPMTAHGYKSWGALFVGTPSKLGPDPVTLTKATTTDAQSVSVDYTILQPDLQSVHFDIYRSPDSQYGFDFNSVSIGKQNVTNPSDLTVGEHKGVKLTLTNANGLQPDTRTPYVIVKSACNGMTDQTYFRKWMLGVVVHGYSTWATKWSTPGLSLISDFSIPAWATRMAGELKAKDGYDDVIVHSWTQSCASSQHGATEAEGVTLSNLVSKWIIAKGTGTNAHLGDVVDIHFIGHNRGVVVVSEAIKDLNIHGPFPELSEGKDCSFGGGYVEVTLLDPIPFNGAKNNSFASFESVLPTDEKLVDLTADLVGVRSPEDLIKALYNPALHSAIVFHFTTDMKKIYQDSSDSEVKIPKDVQTSMVWYQHNNIDLCPKDAIENVFNFWGQVGNKALVDMAVSHANPVDISNKVAGYMQVPDLYEKQIVETGKLNRGNFR